MSRRYFPQGNYRHPTSTEAGDGERRMWCLNPSECDHPGYRHPDDLADLMCAVSARYMVWDSDGDLVIGLRATDGIDDRQVFMADGPYVGYAYVPVYIWDSEEQFRAFCEETVPGKDATRIELQRAFLMEGAYTSRSSAWRKWLIEEDNREDRILSEVRQRLGLEE